MQHFCIKMKHFLQRKSMRQMTRGHSIRERTHIRTKTCPRFILNLPTFFIGTNKDETGKYIKV